MHTVCRCACVSAHQRACRRGHTKCHTQNRPGQASPSPPVPELAQDLRRLGGCGAHVAWLTRKERPAPRAQAVPLRAEAALLPSCGETGRPCAAGRWTAGRAQQTSRWALCPRKGCRTPAGVGVPGTGSSASSADIIPPRDLGERHQSPPRAGPPAAAGPGPAPPTPARACGPPPARAPPWRPAEAAGKGGQEVPRARPGGAPHTGPLLSLRPPWLPGLFQVSKQLLGTQGCSSSMGLALPHTPGPPCPGAGGRPLPPVPGDGLST